MSLLGCDGPLPALMALAACHQRGDGLQLAISVPSFFLCVVLAVSYVLAFHVVAIPRSGLLAQVSSLWLRAGCSGLNLTKHCSQRLPRLPAQPQLASG